MWERARSASAATEQKTGKQTQALLIQPVLHQFCLLHKGYHTHTNSPPSPPPPTKNNIAAPSTAKNTSQKDAWGCIPSQRPSLSCPNRLTSCSWKGGTDINPHGFPGMVLQRPPLSCSLQLLSPQSSSFPLHEQRQFSLCITLWLSDTLDTLDFYFYGRKSQPRYPLQLSPHPQNGHTTSLAPKSLSSLSILL